MTESDTGNAPRSRGLLLAGVFAGAIVVALVVVLVATLGGSSSPAEPRGGPAVQPSPSTTGGSPTRASLSHQVPTEPPEGVRWKLYEGFAIPYSKRAGPYHVDRPVATGYAHTPTGALIAGLQIYARAFLSDGDSWKQVVQRQIVPNEGRQAYVRKLSQASRDDAPPGTYGQVAGFRFVTYTDQTAVIQYVTRFADSGELQVTTYTLRWTDGTWKIVLQPNGSFSPTAQSIRDLTRYVPWGGV